MLSRLHTLLVTLSLLTCSTALTAADGDRGPLNRELPGWLTLAASARFRAEALQGVGFKQDDDRAYVLQRYRFSTEVRPAEWLRLFGEIQDSREAGSPRPGAAFKDVTDLRQAWFALGTEGGFWDLKVGRQRMAFGSERIVGAGEWGNVPRVFDAARLGLHKGRDRVDVFSSSVVHGDTGPFDDHRVAGDNLHGVYGSLGSWFSATKIEPYLFMRTSPDFRGEDASLGRLRSWTQGVRAIDSGTGPWGYETEVSLQRGTIGSDSLRTWAFTGQAQRRWRDRRFSPVAIAEFNFASADRTPGDGVIQTFDQIYPTNHGKYGIVDQVGRRNTRNVRAGLWLSPGEDLMLRAEGHSFWIASRYDALYGAGGGVVVSRVQAGSDSTDVGREFDITADWKPSQHYELGVQCGRLFPGQFLRRRSPGFPRSFYTVYLAVGI